MHQVSQDSNGTKRLSHCHTSALGNLATEPRASKFDKHMAQHVEAKAHGAGLLVSMTPTRGLVEKVGRGHCSPFHRLPIIS